MPDSDRWRTDAFLRVRPFKDEFRRQTVQISKSGRGWINIQNLDSNPDNLVQRGFKTSPHPIDKLSMTIAQGQRDESEFFFNLEVFN